MSITRLYYDDPYLSHFTAHVAERGTHNDRPAVRLDRTAFYPEGGGQPADRGKLGGVEVIDVQDRGGEVWHVLAGPLEAALGAELEGEIDWQWRHDFMQQHHGQHLLSAAFENLFGYVTLSVHMGRESCTLDLDQPSLSVAEATAAEELTNEVIWKNQPILARFVTQQELEGLILRKAPVVNGPIRVVSVPDFDHSPCGGTHPRYTGEVGSVVIRRWERRGETTRVEFLCGRRALHDYQLKNALLSNAAASLSVGVRELPEAISRLREAEEMSRKALWRAQEQLLSYEAVELSANTATYIADTPLVAVSFEDRSNEHLRLLARLLTEQGAIALLGLRCDTAQLIFARPAHLTQDMNVLLREAVAIIGGRGGGRPEQAQGGGPDISRLEEALEHARQRLLEIAS